MYEETCSEKNLKKSMLKIFVSHYVVQYEKNVALFRCRIIIQSIEIKILFIFFYCKSNYEIN